MRETTGERRVGESESGAASPPTMVHHAADFLRTSRRPPRLYRNEGARHATWLELFFDLVYVVAVAQLGLLLHEDLTVRGFVGFAGLFFAVWWTWLGFTNYADQFDTDDLVHRFGMVAVMFAVIALSGTIHDAFRGGSVAFTVAYLVLRLLFIGMYVRVWIGVPEYRSIARATILGTSFSAGIWAASLLFPEPIRFAVWGFSVLASIAVTVVAYLAIEDIPKPASHFPERLGLFTILVLGETVLAVAVGTSGTDWTVGSALTAFAGFFVAVSVWWTYFRNVDENFLDRVFATDEGAWSRVREGSMVHILGHLVVFVGIVTAGVGIAVAIESATEAHSLEPNAAGAVAGGLAIYLVGAALVHRAMLEPLHDHVFVGRLAGSALLVVVALVVPPVAPLVFVGLVVVLLVGLNVFEGFRTYLDSQATAATP